MVERTFRNEGPRRSGLDDRLAIGSRVGYLLLVGIDDRLGIVAHPHLVRDEVRVTLRIVRNGIGRRGIDEVGENVAETVRASDRWSVEVSANRGIVGVHGYIFAETVARPAMLMSIENGWQRETG